jgi:putative nucleotidyltransferase with HDIG domain
MALNILLANPNSDFLTDSAALLTQHNFHVETAKNGRDAQILFSRMPYFAIVIHIDLKDYSAIQVLKFIRNHKLSEKLIVIGCTAEKMKEKEIKADKLSALGVTEILEYEPGKDELKQIIEGHQNIQDIINLLPKRTGLSEEELSENSDDKYLAVEIQSFVPGKNVIFDIFIKLGSKKYLKILHAGDTFSHERFNKYKNEKKLSHFYINSYDRSKLVQWHNFVLGKFATQDKISAEKKIELLKSTSEKMVEGLFVDGLTPQMVEQARTLCLNTFKTLEKEKDIYKLLRQYQDMDPNAYTHSFTVGLFTGMICKQFDWNSKTTFETFVMASLLHDIGKTKLPKELLQKSYSQMNEEEKKLFRTHPQLSVDILEGSKLITAAVKHIILQHHEASNGTGYPFGLKDLNILTSSKILAFANDFVDLLIEKKISPIEGVRVLLSDKEQCLKYNRTVLQNFTNIFIDPSKVHKNIALPSNSKAVPSLKT